MIDKLIDWFAKKKKRRKLRKMEKTLRIKLKKKQVEAVMMENTPIHVLSKWGRVEGKTLCACLWAMLNAQKDISFRELQKYIWDAPAYGCIPRYPAMLPDPDAYMSNMTLNLCRDEYMRLYEKVTNAGIKVPKIVR